MKYPRQQVADRLSVSLAAARRADAACIKGVSDFVKDVAPARCYIAHVANAASAAAGSSLIL
jgi:hypothetical protein